MDEKIEVFYDGEYPTTCMGTLIIHVDGVEVYNKKYCCHSTGSVTKNDNNDFKVEHGVLKWNKGERKEFSHEIRKAVKKKLREYEVCCGGCI